MKFRKIAKRMVSKNTNFSNEKFGDNTAIDDKSSDDDLPSVPIEGEIKIFLDDERPCPEGWTLARTPAEFFGLFNKGEDYRKRITALSLDWYLGSSQVDGIEVVKRLTYEIYSAGWDDEVYLPNLTRVNFHSSDRDRQTEMSKIFREILESPEVNRMDTIRFRRGLPL